MNKLKNTKKVNNRLIRIGILLIVSLQLSEVSAMPLGLDKSLVSKDYEEIEIWKEMEENLQVFSWEHKPMEVYLEAARICDQLNINEFYQYIPNADFLETPSSIATFVAGLRENTKNRVEVAFLTGEAYWYSRPDIIMKRIDYLTTYNGREGKNAPIKKIILDIEPWTLGEHTEWYQTYMEALKTVYTYAKERDIQVGNVIPFWLDTHAEIPNATYLLETIFDCSDEIIIMNYNRYVFESAMDTEIAIAKRKQKKIVSAAECQPVNSDYDVTEHITYAYVGLEALEKDWEKLNEKYQYEGLGFAFHHYEAIKKLLETSKQEDLPR